MIGRCGVGNVLLLLFCFAAGAGLRRMGRLPPATSSVLNAYIVNIGLPAMAFAYLHRLELGRGVLLSAIAPWAMFLAAIALLWPVCRLAGFSRQTTGCVLLLGGLGNTSFMGLPMIEAFYGPEWMSIGIVMDQIGSYVALTFLGIALARIFAAGPRPSPGEVVARIVQFPPFLATVAALALSPVAFPGWLTELFERLALTVAPLALISVGFQLRLSDVGGRVPALAVALSFKLILGPALVLAVFGGLLGMRGTLLQVTVFEAAMAPMIGASIVAMENELDPQLATLLVGIGVPASFLTLAVWHQLLLGV